MFGPEPRADVDDELAFHLEMRAREQVDRGEPADRARALALQRFGDYEHSRRQCVLIDERRQRAMARTTYLTELRQDLGYALRMLRRAPGFTAVAVATLALGIGANSAIFSVVHGVLLQALPFRDADQLYRVRMLYPDGTAYSTLSAPDFMSVREESRTFGRVEAYASGAVTLLGSGEPREARGSSVSNGLFELLGLPMAVGRTFLPGEHQPGQNMVVVLDHGFWSSQFAADPGVLGRTVTIDGKVRTVVGVLGPGARPPAEADIYMPLVQDEAFSATTATRRRAEYLGVIGLARPGVTRAQVDQDLRRIGTRLQSAFPDTNNGLTLTATALREMMVGGVRTPLLVLLGAVGFVLLVACANVANLLLARASARRGELALRAALGAGRGRLIRQLLTEAAVLGLAGGSAGLAIAYWGTRLLVAAQPADIPRLDHVAVNSVVVLVTLVIALITSVAFGMVPALHMTRARPTHALGGGARIAGGGRRARATLVVAEMALAVVLLIGAGLLLRSFAALTRVDPGFQTARAMAFRVTLQGEAYQDPARARQRVGEFEERIRALPGVGAVGVATVLPLSGLGAINDFLVEGAPPPPPNVNAEIAVASATPGYFEAIGTPLRRGRGFTDRDRSDAPLVALINEAAVRQWFPHQDPLGARVSLSDRSYEIVGVVADVLQQDSSQRAAPQLFQPYAQRTARSLRIVVRTAGDPLTLAPAIRGQVRALDPGLAIAAFTPLAQLVDKAISRPRFYATLLALFAFVALALAATGIFGVTNYAVSQQAREISIRMALGAPAGQVQRMIIGRTLRLASIGLASGLFAALALGRVIRSQLFEVGLLDPVTLGGVALLMLASAALASLLPARRAARLDPGLALRQS